MEIYWVAMGAIGAIIAAGIMAIALFVQVQGRKQDRKDADKRLNEELTDANNRHQEEMASRDKKEVEEMGAWKNRVAELERCRDEQNRTNRTLDQRIRNLEVSDDWEKRVEEEN